MISDLGKSVRVSRVRRISLSIARHALYAFRAQLGWSALWRLAIFVGTVEWMLKPAARRRVRQSIEREVSGLSDAALRRATLRHFRRTRCDKWFFLLMDRLSGTELSRRVRIEGRQHLDAALSRGAGAYVVLSHFGFHDIGAAMLARVGYPCAGIRAKLDSAARRYMRSRLARAGDGSEPVRQLATSSFPREIYRWFRENRVVGSAIDIPPGGEYRVETLQVEGPAGPREYMIGPLRIALRCGAGIVTGSIESQPRFRFVVRLEPLGAGIGDESEAIRGLLLEYSQRTAEFALRHPDHVSRV